MVAVCEEDVGVEWDPPNPDVAPVRAAKTWLLFPLCDGEKRMDACGVEGVWIVMPELVVMEGGSSHLGGFGRLAPCEGLVVKDVAKSGTWCSCSC
jgi:hypothetical protein